MTKNSEHNYGAIATAEPVVEDESNVVRTETRLL